MVLIYSYIQGKDHLEHLHITEAEWIHPKQLQGPIIGVLQKISIGTSACAEILAACQTMVPFRIFHSLIWSNRHFELLDIRVFNQMKYIFFVMHQFVVNYVLKIYIYLIFDLQLLYFMVDQESLRWYAGWIYLFRPLLHLFYQSYSLYSYIYFSQFYNLLIEIPYIRSLDPKVEVQTGIYIYLYILFSHAFPLSNK